MRAGFVAFVLSIVFWGSFSQARPVDPITSEELQARIAELRHTPWNGKATESHREIYAGCRSSRVQIEIIDPLTLQSKPLVLRVYRPARSAKVPVMIVIPTIMGTTVVEPDLAYNFCGGNIGTVIADVNDPTIPSKMPAWGIEDRNSRWAIMALRTVIDMVEQMEVFDRDRIGVMGVSLGGITAAMLSGVEPQRLKATVIVVAGGNMPFILSTSDNKDVAEFRNRRMRHMGINDKIEYENILHNTIRFDPMHFVPNIDKNRVMMVAARRDTKVPYSTQKELFLALGKPEAVEYNAGHVETILEVTYFSFGSVMKFVKSRFGQSYAPSLLQASNED
jgi:cephalosporin-C deacetylase-like acetyl esterase